MKKIIIIFLLSLIFTSCSSVEYSNAFNQQKLTQQSDVKEVALINADNFGYYLFNVVPLITGDNDEVGKFRILKDTVTVDGITKLITAKARELGATNIVDLHTEQNETCQLRYFTFGILWYKNVQASGVAATKF